MNKVQHFSSPQDEDEEKANIPKKEILVIGAEGAGKTLLSRRMKEKCANTEELSPESTVPTTGTEIIDLEINGNPFICREVGSAMSSSWGKFIRSCDYMLFVVDISDPGSYGSAYVHLIESLESLKNINDSKPLEQMPPVLLAFNKADLTDSKTLSMAKSIFRIQDFVASYQSSSRKFQTFSGCSMNFALSSALLGWISEREKSDVKG